MDALAGYGSDSDSSSSLSTAVPKNVQEYQHRGHPSDADTKEQSGTTRKRPWGQIERDGNQTLHQPGLASLPPPPLSADGNMIQWEADFLSTKLNDHRNNKSSGLSEQVTTLQAMTEKIERECKEESQKISSKTKPQHSWVSVVKAQHEFHNPRFLDNVASQCGITSVMGSNIQRVETFDDYEFNLLGLEEKARMQAFSPINDNWQTATTAEEMGTSQFAQQQLEEALQKQCHR